MCSCLFAGDSAMWFQQTCAFLQADDTEGAPLLAEAAAVAPSSPPSQVITKDEVHTTKFLGSCDLRLKMYSARLVWDVCVCYPCSSKGHR